MASRIQFRRGTAASWASVNPVLAQGEPGFETDTHKSKVGDGTTAWNSLSYSQIPGLDALLTAHESDTTSVHGISNTANLVYTSDSRLSDARTPTDGSVTTAKIADGAVTSAKIADGAIVNADINASAAIAPSKIDGTAVITTDSRLSDARTPTAHKASHAIGGADALSPSDIGAIPSSEKGANSGVATLDGSGKVPSTQLPAIAITSVSVVASQSAMLALTAEEGDVAIRTDQSKSYVLAASPASTLANWKELLTPTDTVLSVDGRTGAVALSDLYVSKAGDTVSGTMVVSANSSSDALRITQVGAGNALVVEDSANPDSTPFVVNAAGQVILGTSSPLTGAVNSGVTLTSDGSTAPNSNIYSRRYSSDATATSIGLSKARGSLASPSIVSSADRVGDILFPAYDGANYLAAGQIFCEVDGTPGTNDMPGRLVFSTTADGASSPTERMRITNAGNVGIGTSSPTVGLELGGAVGGASQIRLKPASNTVDFRLNPNFGSADLPSLSVVSNHPLSFHTNNIERLRITSSGNVGIGTSAPAARLDVAGAITGTHVEGRSAEEILREAVWWIDASHAGPGQVVKNLGWGGSQLDAMVGSTYGSDSNDPKWLGFDGVPYCYLPGVGGNYLSVPDEAALDITGDIDIRVRVALDDWTPATSPVLVDRWGNSGAYANNRSWQLSIDTVGKPVLITSSSGTALTKAFTSSVATGVTDGAVKWVRATLDVDNGAGGATAKFWLSDDGVSWTQLGTDQTSAGATSLLAPAMPLNIGSDVLGTSNMLIGKVYRAIVKNGIDGTTVLDVDTSVLTSGSQTSFTALTGQTVTINRATSGRKSTAVVAPVWLLGTDDYLEVPDNDLLDFGETNSFTVLVVARQWATPTGYNYYIGKCSSDAKNGYAFTSNGSSLGLYQSINDGTNAATRIAAQTLTSGALSSMGFVVDRTAQTIASLLNGTVSATASTSAVGRLENAKVLRVGRNPDAASGYQDFEMVAAAVFRRALTASEIAVINAYYQNRGGQVFPRNARAFPILSGNGTPYQISIDDDGSLVTTAL